MITQEDREKWRKDIAQERLAIKFTRWRTFKEYISSIDEEFKLPKLELKQGDYVMDLGCGYGYAVPGILEKVGPDGRVVAVDLDSRSLQYACDCLNGKAEREQLPELSKIYKAVYLNPKEEVGERPIKEREKEDNKRYVIFYDTSAEGMLRCPDNYFDYVLAMYIFSYIPNKINALFETNRVLKKGGKAYLTWTGHVVTLKERPDREVLGKVKERFHDYAKGVNDALWATGMLEEAGIDYDVCTLPEFVSKHITGVKMISSKSRDEEYVGTGYFKKTGKLRWKKELELFGLLYGYNGISIPLYIKE